MHFFGAVSNLTWKELAITTIKEIKNKRVLDHSAILAFYFLLSLFPFLLILVTIFGMLLSSRTEFQQAIQTIISKNVQQKLLKLAIKKKHQN